MKKNIVFTLILAVLLVWMVIPAWAGEDYSDGDSEQVFVWIQEGDNVFCYIDGEYDESHMLTGWHQIGNEIYWFEDSDFSDDHPIGSMAKNEWRWINDAEWHFDEYGHLDEWRIGLE